MKPIGWRPPTLTTERLILRAFAEDDAEPLFAHACNTNVARFTLWDAHRTIDDTLLFLRDYAVLRYLEGMPEPYAIVIPPDPRPVGSCGCFWASRPHQTMELGYWIGEPFWGKGYIVEASRSVLNLAFKEHRPQRMQARVIDGNEASMRVLQKLGFTTEGKLRRALLRRGNFEDVWLFSILREEWSQTASNSRR
jgi:ribosomal-protein-alanine N-acetyltransferase